VGSKDCIGLKRELGFLTTVIGTMRDEVEDSSEFNDRRDTSARKTPASLDTLAGVRDSRVKEAIDQPRITSPSLPAFVYQP
jgi:hypothetical protein